MISNSKPIAYINMLLQLGLIDDIKKLAYGRIICQDPQQGVYSFVYRPLAVEIFNKLLDYVLNDMVMYNRLRQLLIQDHSMQDHPISEAAFDNLVAKGDKAGIDLLKIIEWYNEGYHKDFPSHLSKEQRAYNFLNIRLDEITKQKRIAEVEDKAENKSAALRALQVEAKRRKIVKQGERLSDNVDGSKTDRDIEGSHI